LVVDLGFRSFVSARKGGRATVENQEINLGSQRRFECYRLFSPLVVALGTIDHTRVSVFTGATMFNVMPPSSSWSAWLFLSICEKLFAGALIALSVYTLFAATSTTICVRKARASIRAGIGFDFEGGFIKLRKRSARLHKLIGTCFYLFGALLFLSLQWAYFRDNISSMSGERAVLINFYPHFALAFYVFLDLLVLHLLGWFISISANAFGLHLKAPQLE
jgi:hypothetical protein